MDSKKLADIARTKRNLYLIEKLHAGKALTKAEISELEELDMKNSSDITVEPRFKTRVEVVKYLKTEGWKVEKSKLYKDANKIGRQKDGSYLKRDVDAYARLALQRLDGAGENVAGFAREKAAVELRILKEKEREARRENEIEEGKWILRSEAEQKHTAKLALFLTAFDNFVAGGKLEEAIDIVGGDREKAPEFKKLIKAEVRAMLAEYAKAPAFTVPQKAMAEAESFKSEANAN